MNRRLGLLALACTLATLALYSLGRALATADVAQAAPVPDRAAPPAPAADPRWLQLVRSTTLASSALAPATAGPTVDYLITDQFVVGHVPLASTVIVEVTRGGSQVAEYHLAPIPDQNGFLYAASLAGTVYDWPSVKPIVGDVIWVTQATASISLTVPALDGLSTAATDMVSGTAPANSSLLLYLYPVSDPATVYTRAVSANGIGDYQSLWSPEADIRPRDSGYVRYTLDSNRQAYARFVTPFLRAQVHGFAAEGYAAPHSEVIVSHLSITGSELGRRWSAADANGQFTACLGTCPYSGDNQPAYEPGETLVITAAGQTISLTLPTLSAQVDLAGGRVHGQTAPNEPVTIARFSGPMPESGGNDGPPASLATVTATASGAYSLTLPLQQRDYGEATVTSPEGNEAYARFAVPYLSAHQEAAFGFGYAIEGQIDDQAKPLTITVEGASGYLKGLRSTRVGTTGYFIDSYYFYYGSDAPNIALETGDTLTLTTARGVQLAYTIPLLTAHADVASQTISGQAPPGAAVTIVVSSFDAALNEDTNPRPDNYTFVVTATVQGTYSLDFAALGHFGVMATGSVAYPSPAGHIVIRNFRTLQNCLPTLQLVQVFGNFLWGGTDYHNQPGYLECGATTVTLRDGQGQLKFSETLPLYQYGNFFLTLLNGSQPIIIRPGDHLALSNNAQVLDYVVPQVSVVLNPQAGTITGQAQPGAALTIEIADQSKFGAPGFAYATLTTTATPQGTYQLTYPLRAGDRVTVWPAGHPRFIATGVMPVLTVSLHQSTIAGQAAPLVPFTLALQTSRPLTGGPLTGTTDSSGNLFSWVGQAPWTFEPGDTVVLTTPASVRAFTLPALTARLDRANGTVTGTAPAGARLTVVVDGLSRVVTATAQGLYQVAFGYQPFGTQGNVIFTSNNGDVAELEFSAPMWSVILHSACVGGNAPLPEITTVVTLTAPGGAIKGVQQVLPNYYDGRFSACFPSLVESGDRLSMSGPGGPLTYIVPALTASHDPVNHWVTGTAPANSLVTFNLRDNRLGPFVPVVRQLLVGSSGSYGLDVSDLQLRLGEINSVAVQDLDGNRVQRDFMTEGWRAFLPGFAQ
jgi:hypothetical protein